MFVPHFNRIGFNVYKMNMKTIMTIVYFRVKVFRVIKCSILFNLISTKAGRNFFFQQSKFGKIGIANRKKYG